MEVAEALELSSLAYDAAKRAARVGKAKTAHDGLVAAAHRVQADALEIEAAAKRRLADEYDAAQRRGEVGQEGRPKTVTDGNGLPVAADLGLSRKQLYDARQSRNAEAKSPGIVRRVLNDKLDAGSEPTRAALRRAFSDIIREDNKAAKVERRNGEAVERFQQVRCACSLIDDIVGEHGLAAVLAGASASERDDAITLFGVCRHHLDVEGLQ